MYPGVGAGLRPARSGPEIFAKRRNPPARRQTDRGIGLRKPMPYQIELSDLTTRGQEQGARNMTAALSCSSSVSLAKRLSDGVG